MQAVDPNAASITEWMGSIAAILSALFGVVALLIARQANTTAERSRIEAAERQRESERREAARDRRAVAGRLQAWWGRLKVEDGDPVWGIVISNQGPLTTVFYDIEIQVTANWIKIPLYFDCLPPGLYFRRNDQPGRLPEFIPSLSQVIPITSQRRHRIDSLSFTDPLGVHWYWTPREGIRELAPGEKPRTREEHVRSMRGTSAIRSTPLRSTGPVRTVPMQSVARVRTSGSDAPAETPADEAAASPDIATAPAPDERAASRPPRVRKRRRVATGRASTETKAQIRAYSSEDAEPATASDPD